jgi:pantoate--beta-alanine ligase
MAAKLAFEEGEKNAELLRRVMAETIQSEPLARLHYISIASPASLAELKEVEGDALFSMAVSIGSTRLIDNFLLQNKRWMTGQWIDQVRT